MIFNRLLYDNRFGKGLVVAFGMNGHSSSTEELLLSVAETMGGLVDRPLVLSFLLLSRGEVPVRLVVHLGYVLSFFLFSSFRVQDFLGAL